MDSELFSIKNIVQEIAEAIAAALNIEVEIFDNNLVVVGATGRIRSKIGFKQETSHVSNHTLKTGASCTIENPGQHQLCKNCKIRNNCFCTSALVCPIALNGKVFGTISLLSFDANQREQLLSRQGQYLDFISRMGELIAGQFELHQALNQVAKSEQNLKTIIDTVNEGIIAVNAGAEISYFNKAAERLLDLPGDLLIGKAIEELFEKSLLPAVIKKCSPVREREITYVNQNHQEVQLIYSAYPIILGEHVVGAVKTFRDIKTLTQLSGGLATRHETVSFEDICGRSSAILNLIEQARIVSTGRSTILLQGESGTGKELFARAIYQASPFRNGPFQVINCSAIPESLLESELFGYEEGAFTGARKGGKPGKFELADGGTLFLDEIGDMPLYLQAKLLRVLESNTLERVGGTREYHFNTRIIAATNKDLNRMVSEGRFREDLYYRLNVIPLSIPSLRERREDIITLAEYFLGKYAFLMNKRIGTLSEEVKETLLRYHWPGNARELENAIEYAVNFEQSSRLSKTSLPLWLLNEQKEELHTSSRLKSRTRGWEQDVILNMLEEHGNTLEAKKMIARRLGISLTTLYRKLKAIEMIEGISHLPADD